MAHHLYAADQEQENIFSVTFTEESQKVLLILLHLWARNADCKTENEMDRGEKEGHITFITTQPTTSPEN